MSIELMNESEAQSDIARLEAEIERLAEAAERCRKIIWTAKAAIALGAGLLAAILLGLIRADATPLFGSLAAIIGGIVVSGSNASTAQQMADQIAAAESERAELIGGIDLRLVSDVTSESPRAIGRAFADDGRPHTLH